MILHCALDVLAEAARVKIVIADRLDKGVCIHNVQETNGALARRLVVFRQELPAHVDEFKNDEGAEVLVTAFA